jgi:hypothetical protein
MVRCLRPPSQTRTFLDNHLTQLVSIDFFTVPFPFDQLPRYLLRDRDAIFGQDFREHARRGHSRSAVHAVLPWQRA